MTTLLNDFNQQDDDDDNEDIAPPFLVRPMEPRDAWDMVALWRRQHDYRQPLPDQLARKNTFEEMLPHSLVAVKPGGKIIGYGIAPTGVKGFANKRGILQIIVDPDEDRHTTTHALIRGIARQVMAQGQTTLEMVINRQDAFLYAAQKEYRAAPSGIAYEENALGHLCGWVYKIDNLVTYFGHKAKPPVPKAP